MLNRARAADARGDRAACLEALSKARSGIPEGSEEGPP